jgi:hypothetical protein
MPCRWQCHQCHNRMYSVLYVQYWQIEWCMSTYDASWTFDVRASYYSSWFACCLVATIRGLWQTGPSQSVNTTEAYSSYSCSARANSVKLGSYYSLDKSSQQTHAGTPHCSLAHILRRHVSSCGTSTAEPRHFCCADVPLPSMSMQARQLLQSSWHFLTHQHHALLAAFPTAAHHTATVAMLCGKHTTHRVVHFRTRAFRVRQCSQHDNSGCPSGPIHWPSRDRLGSHGAPTALLGVVSRPMHHHVTCAGVSA